MGQSNKDVAFSRGANGFKAGRFVSTAQMGCSVSFFISSTPWCPMCLCRRNPAETLDKAGFVDNYRGSLFKMNFAVGRPPVGPTG
jgi:hypothetical protein